MEKYNIRNTLECIFVFKGPYMWCKIAYMDDIANLEILPYGLHFSEVMWFTILVYPGVKHSVSLLPSWWMQYNEMGYAWVTEDGDLLKLSDVDGW